MFTYISLIYNRRNRFWEVLPMDFLNTTESIAPFESVIQLVVGFEFKSFSFDLGLFFFI
jgi:hypothetical protein